MGTPNAYDHGYMFGGPNKRIRAKEMASRYLDSRIYRDMPIKRLKTWVEAVQMVHPDQYWHLLDAIPSDWKTPAAMTALARFIGRLLNKDLAATVVERMDAINQVFLRLRSEGKPAWRAHCDGEFYPTRANLLDAIAIETEVAWMD
jgi:hypothetical protein